MRAFACGLSNPFTGSTRMWVLTLGVVVLATIAGCGGGGSAGPVPLPIGGGAVPRPMGLISIALSSAPVGEAFVQALALISQVRLVATTANPADDVIVRPQLHEIDLLQLSSFSEVLFTAQVPIDATYYAVDLRIESLRLVRTDGTWENVAIEGGGYSPDPHSIPAPSLVWWSDGPIDTRGQFEPFGVRASNPMSHLMIKVDIPLDEALRDEGTFYRLSPFAVTSVPVDDLLRVAGRVDQIVVPNAKHPAGALRICEIEKLSDPAWTPSVEPACAFVAMLPSTHYFDTEASPAAAGFGDLVVNDPVVIYGNWGIYVEESGETYTADVVARGADFRVARGTASQFDTQSASFTLNESLAECPSAVSPTPIAVDGTARVYRKNERGMLPEQREGIAACLNAVAEGADLASGVRAFALVVQPPTILGVLTRPNGAAQSRFQLGSGGAMLACIDVAATTQVWRFAFRSFGAGYLPTTVTDLLGSRVIVTGERTANGCVAAERVAYVE